MILSLSSALPPKPPVDLAPMPATMMAKAQELEAAFLAEMLAHSGLGESSGPFSGGAGEAQFTSFLREEQARMMAEKGGIGLAELIFRSMSREE
jgi:peptidoglycan hydrolase FlgJ